MKECSKFMKNDTHIYIYNDNTIQMNLRICQEKPVGLEVLKKSQKKKTSQQNKMLRFGWCCTPPMINSLQNF